MIFYRYVKMVVEKYLSGNRNTTNYKILVPGMEKTTYIDIMGNHVTYDEHNENWDTRIYKTVSTSECFSI